MRRKYKLRLGLLIGGIILCLSGITYAYLRSTKYQDNDNVLSTISCLAVSLVDKNKEITINDAFAVEDNYAIEYEEPYIFTIKNTCPVDIVADINFDTMQTEKQLDKKHVRLWLNSDKFDNAVLNNLGGTTSFAEVAPTIDGAVSSNYITTIELDGGKSQEFELKLWIDYDTTAEEGMNKIYKGRVVIISSPKPELADLKIYGVKRDIDTSSSTWTRTDDGVGLVANAQVGNIPVQNDFDNLYPWSAVDTYAYNLSTGEEISLTEVGVNAFPFTGTDSEGNEYEILTRIPEFYYQRYQQKESDGKTYEYVKIANRYVKGFTKSETFSVGRYTISGVANDVHSRSGVYPLGIITITNFRNYARRLGDDFGQLDYRYFILQLLYLVEYADYNSQSKLGQGHTTSPSYDKGGGPINSGGTNTLGMTSGTIINDGKHSVIYRGIEDIFGNVWQFVDGINIKDYVTYVCTDPSKYAVDTFTECYKPVGYTNLTSNRGDISKLGYDANNPLVAMPIVSGGSASTHITDYYWSATGNRIALVGGNWDHTSQAGLWFWNVNVASSDKYANVCSRLLRYK